jgi:acyl transferase domain-containing protein
LNTQKKNGTEGMDEIAIVGLACRYAGAADLAAFWGNAVTGRSAISEHPSPLAARILDPASPLFERLHTQRGGYLRELNTFQPEAFGLAPNALAGANPDQFLAIHLGATALRQAGLDAATVAAHRTGLVLGYAAPLNPASANWLQHGLVVDQTINLLHRLFPGASESQLNEIRQSLKESLPPMRPAGLRTSFGHALAGHCAATLRLTGTVCAVDAGAASSLLALRVAMDELLLDRCDLMLAGAVQNCTSLPALMGLACLHPCTLRDAPVPLSREADGTLPGEGGGFLVLKRRRQAEQDGNTIFALLKSVALSACDTPLREGRPDPQRLADAMQQAHRQALITPATIGFLETHGSGIPYEDQLEIQAMRRVFPEHDGQIPRTRIVLGACKAQIGHCHAAAGLAGIIKAAMALHHRLLPPLAPVRTRLQARLAHTSSPFLATTAPRPWVQGGSLTPRRAAVTAFDTSSALAHAVLEEYTRPSS